MAGYFSDLCQLRAREPGDDVISAMILATEAGEMTYPGLIATCEALLIGGFVTTANIIGNAVVGLTAHPDQREALLAEPELVSQLVEEVLRLEAPAQYSVRITREPVTLAGQRLDKGVPIVTLLAGANRDPAVFEQPYVLNIRRRNAKEHLSFAAGIHYCIGAGLARLEGRIALAGLFRRYPHLRIDGRVRYCPSRVIRGPMKLPVIAR
jgi:cytochrome P450